MTDYPGGFVVVKSEFGRMHLFASEARDEIIRKIQEHFHFEYICLFCSFFFRDFFLNDILFVELHFSHLLIV